MYLKRFSTDLHPPVSGHHLGHGRFPVDFLALVFQPGGAQREQPSGIQIGRHLRQHELNRLETGKRLVELMAFLRILDAFSERAAGDTERQRRNADPAAVQDPHGVPETAVQLAEQVFLGDAAILQNQLGGVAGAQTQFVLLVPGAETGSPLFNDEGADAFASH